MDPDDDFVYFDDESDVSEEELNSHLGGSAPLEPVDTSSMTDEEIHEAFWGESIDAYEEEEQESTGGVYCLPIHY